MYEAVDDGRMLADHLCLKQNESRETEQIRNAAVRNAVFLTFLFVFGGMLWRVLQGDVINVDTSSFLTFLIL